MLKKSFIILTLCALTTSNAQAAQNNAVQNDGQNLRGAAGMLALFLGVSYLNTRSSSSNLTPCSGGICPLAQQPVLKQSSVVCVTEIVDEQGIATGTKITENLIGCAPKNIRYVTSPSAIFPKNND